MFIDRLAIRRLGLRVGHEARFAQGLLLARSQHEMIDPFKEVGAGLVAHAVREAAGEGVPLQERSRCAGAGICSASLASGQSKGRGVVAAEAVLAPCFTGRLAAGLLIALIIVALA